MTPPVRPCVLLDRDGVLNVDRPGSLLSLDDLELIPGVGEAVAEINRKGYDVLVVTNQACVSRGELGVETLERIHAEIARRISDAGGRIAGWFVCMHGDADHCGCRKPAPGLIEMARKEFGFHCSETWMIGDASRDIQAASAAGCKPGLVLTGKGTTVVHGLSPDSVFDDLPSFSRSLAPANTNR